MRVNFEIEGDFQTSSQEQIIVQSVLRKKIGIFADVLECFQKDGEENCFFYPHYPSCNFGVEISPGYDCRYRTAEEIKQDMKTAGLPNEYVEILAKAAGLYEEKADRFCKENSSLKLTPEMKTKIFDQTYPEYRSMAMKVLDNMSLLNEEQIETVIDLWYQCGNRLRSETWKSEKDIIDTLKKTPIAIEEKRRIARVLTFMLNPQQTIVEPKKTFKEEIEYYNKKTKVFCRINTIENT